LEKETATARAATNLQRVRQIADLTADSIDRLVEKILVFKDKHIEVYFKFTDGLAVTNAVNVEGGEHDGHDGVKQAG
jgi:hypothetical protein